MKESWALPVLLEGHHLVAVKQENGDGLKHDVPNVRVDDPVIVEVEDEKGDNVLEAMP